MLVPQRLFRYPERMKLLDYLAQPGKTASALAADCGVAVSTITRAAKGEIDPSGALMKDIFKYTDGAVTANDFHGMAA